MKKRPAIVLCAVWIPIALAARLPAQAQSLTFPSKAVDKETLVKAIPELAKSALRAYQESDRQKYLGNAISLHLAAGDYAAAVATLDSLLALTPGAVERMMPFRMFAGAKKVGPPFDEAFKRSFRERFGTLENLAALRQQYWFVANVKAAESDLLRTLDRQKGKSEISLEDALVLVRQYTFLNVFRTIAPLVPSLIDEDDHRRYLMQDDVLIRMRDGATVAAIVVRPKDQAGRSPAAFNFTIYASESIPDSVKLAAAHGFAGVVAFTRGKRHSPDQPVPYEHDGDDARDVIDWIAKQPWSDGQVGMFGGSYDGFTQWAAAKKQHPALKTIVPYVAAIPGLGLPMENNVFLNANYGWAFYVTNNKYLDHEAYNDPRLSLLNEKWYAGGKPYRSIDLIDGVPNKWLQRWLKHPAYDTYWQAMVPYRKDFAKIKIPVLTITGFFDDGQISALHYLKEHYKYNRNAEHYLLIGPWDHFGSQASRKADVLRGYAIDPVAQVDTPEITFQWLNYVMRGGKKPELLKDRINYQTMGSNSWRHVPSLAATHKEVLTLYLTNEKIGEHYRLAAKKPARAALLEQTVDFSDRKTSTNLDYYPAPIVRRKPGLSSGYAFLSDPFDVPVSIDGSFAGELRAQINKRDMDVGVVLYEVMPNGDWFHLSYFIGRASFAKDMSRRRLLKVGKTEAIPFDRTRMTSRRLSKGSRLLVLLNVNKNRFAQLNYGTGKDVSDESIADAGAPLRVLWRNDSYVKIPIWRQIP